MNGWRRHHGHAVVLDRENIDTDQLIPARFMSTPRAEGYGRFLLHDLRHDPDGNLLPGFPLNRYPNASVLITRRNFGSGSSREAAVYALVDFGIRAVIAPSFGDIFAGNAANNGLLAARASVDDVDRVIAALGDQDAAAEIDLEQGTLHLVDITVHFALEAVRREKLINGWDDIDLTRQHSTAIAAFRAAYARRNRWAFPPVGNAD